MRIRGIAMDFHGTWHCHCRAMAGLPLHFFIDFDGNGYHDTPRLCHNTAIGLLCAFMALPWPCLGLGLDFRALPMPAMVLPWAFMGLHGTTMGLSWLSMTIPRDCRGPVMALLCHCHRP